MEGFTLDRALVTFLIVLVFMHGALDRVCKGMSNNGFHPLCP